MSSQQLRAIRATGKWALVYALGAMLLNLVCQTLGTYLLWWADLQKGSSRPLGFGVQFVVNVLQGASDFTVIGLCAATAFIAWRVAGTVEGGSE